MMEKASFLEFWLRFPTGWQAARHPSAGFVLWSSGFVPQTKLENQIPIPDSLHTMNRSFLVVAQVSNLLLRVTRHSTLAGDLPGVSASYTRSNRL